jgi:hypothetical protein
MIVREVHRLVLTFHFLRREALYILDGLVKSGSEIQPEIVHYAWEPTGFLLKVNVIAMKFCVPGCHYL